ncbi:Hypp3480 [Branchiostoma lanceolatum]|uniref:Hypp3480 protein n=1 Tax=Branchiostoma lanceolatum TaxID=7740 RepID=A0A8K0ES46_BRALA|nr:Hypp3480 [Branchiostoma lanceolatum]
MDNLIREVQEIKDSLHFTQKETDDTNSTLRDHEHHVKRAKYLKGSNIYINEDFSEKVRQKRKELIQKMKEARERGDIEIRQAHHPPPKRTSQSGNT